MFRVATSLLRFVQYIVRAKALVGSTVCTYVLVPTGMYLLIVLTSHQQYVSRHVSSPRLWQQLQEYRTPMTTNANNTIYSLERVCYCVSIAGAEVTFQTGTQLNLASRRLLSVQPTKRISQSLKAIPGCGLVGVEFNSQSLCSAHRLTVFTVALDVVLWALWHLLNLI